jgi:ATP-dependent Clp protease ATP-binding subunit ClpC
MFERYNEKARRVIFTARYEASELGTPQIEVEHLLLGVLGEDRELRNYFLPTYRTVEAVRTEVEEHLDLGPPIPATADMPLSQACKRVLAYTMDEADHHGDRTIEPGHLLAGILRENESFAAGWLWRRGVRLEAVRKTLGGVLSVPLR